MSKSLISTILFGTQAMPDGGRLVSFDTAREFPPEPLSLRREIIELLETVSSPISAANIATALGFSRAVISEQLGYLTEAELVQPVYRRGYALIPYLKGGHR